MRLSLFVLALTGGFILACGTGDGDVEEEETEKVEEPVEEPPPPPRRGKADRGVGVGAPTTFQCCGVPVVQDMMKEYLDLQTTLFITTDPESKPSGECYALTGQANAVAKDPAVRPADQKTAAEFAALMDRVKTGKVGEIRADLDKVTGYVSEIARAYPGGTLTVAEAECVGQGSWLQEDAGGVFKSPYGVVAGGVRAGKGKRGDAVAGCHWK